MLTARLEVRSNRLPAILGALTGRTAALNKAAAERVAARARSTVHVITGATRGSIRVEQAGGAAAVVAEHGAVFEEYGTSRRPPHPFMTPAAEAERGTHLADFRKVFLG